MRTDEHLSLFEATPALVIALEISDDGEPDRFVAASDAACRALAYTREQLLSLDPASVWMGSLHGDALRCRLLSGDTARFDARVRRGDGETITLDVSACAHRRDGRRVLVATAREIDDPTELTNELRRTRDRLDLSERFARVGSVDWDVVSGEQAWSDSMYELLGYAPGAAKAGLTTFLEHVRSEDRQEVVRLARRVLDSGEPVEGLVRIVRADDVARVLHGRMGGFRDRQGHVVRVFVTVGDVTEQDEARRAVEATEQRLALAQRIAQVGSIDWDLVTGRGWWSDELYRILGLEPGEVRPGLEAYLEFVHEDDRTFVLEGIREMQRTGAGRNVDIRIRRRGGERRVINATTIFVRDDDGKPVRQLTTVQDVTDRKHMEQRLEESEAFLLKAQEVAKLGSWVVDLASGAVTWSDELYRICGVTPQTWDGRVESFLDELCLPEDRPAAENAWQLMLTTGAAHDVEYRVRRPDGSVRNLLTRGQAMLGADGEPTSVVGASQDITEIRQAEQALRLSEERFELAAYGSSDGLWDWSDVTADALWVSPRFAELLGYSTDAFESSVAALTRAIHREDRARVMARVHAHLERDAPFDVELRMSTSDGAYKWFRMRGKVVRDAGGRPARMAGSLLDIDESKAAESKLHSYQARLRSLAASVATAAERERRRIAAELHDRTVQTLAALRMKLDALRGPGPVVLNEDRRDEIFALIDSAIHETRELLHEIGPPVLYELGFASAVDWLGERAAKQYGLRCTTQFDETMPAIADDVQMALFQCIRELLTNVGKHARATHVRVSITAGGAGLRVEVSDDGTGFEAGEAVDAPSPTGGFGLFSVRERLRVVGGKLRIESGTGGGARLTLIAPTLTQG